jgi:jasmonic acid-amino synthetase
VKVAGFYNSTPELKFVCRSNLLLTINIDKNTERDLQLVVEEAAKILSEEKQEVVDYSSHIDLSTDPGHYVIFWEISGEAIWIFPYVIISQSMFLHLGLMIFRTSHLNSSF